MGGKNGTYSLCSVDAMIKTIFKRFGKVVKRRWVFQCLRYMEDIGMINRKERKGQNTDGTYWQKSSQITLCAKGARYLWKMGVAGAKTLWKSIIAWAEGKDKRWPNKKDIYPLRTNSNEIEIPRGLKALVGMVGTSV